MSRLAPALLAAAVLCAACAGGTHGRRAGGLPAGGDDGAAREVLGRFAAALEAGRFDEAHALLSARWRAAYGPGRLALDFRGAGPDGRAAVARVLAGLSAREPLERSAAEARLATGNGRAAMLVLEAGAWRVDALE